MIKLIDMEQTAETQPRQFRITKDLARRISVLRRKARKKNYNELFEALVSMGEEQVQKELKNISKSKIAS